MLKKFCYSFVCLLFLLIKAPSLEATHVLGAEFSYTCINNCVVQVHFKGYMECSSLGTVSPGSFIFVPQGPNCQVPVPLNAWTANPTPIEVTPICPSYAPNTCTDPNAAFPGVLQVDYFRDYNVCSGGACVFDVRWSTCCRSPSILNLQSPASNVIQLEGAIFDNSLPSCNSTPSFLTSPPAFICSGQNVVISMAAVDPDGDSLSYSLTNCMNGTNMPATSAAGYSYLQPFGSSWNLSMDPVSGDLSFVAQPGLPGAFNICIMVEEWRNGVLVNAISRDYVLRTVPCPNIPCLFNLAEGKAYMDNNSNCQYDSADVPAANRQILVLPDSLIILTNALGEYHYYPDSGTYTFQQIPNPFGIWQQTCPVTAGHTVTFPGINDTIGGLDFGNEVLYSCPMMWADIAVVLTRPCSLATFFVAHCNLGSDTAYNVTFDVTLDTNFTYSSSSIPLVGSVGSTYTFSAGTMPPNECRSMSLDAFLNCDTGLVGRTLCHSVHIYPDSSCLPVNPIWDQSSLEIVGSCVGDSLVCFDVNNSSSFPMQNPTDWRLYQNGNLAGTGTLQLCGSCDTTICFPANGFTLRMEVDQSIGHPSSSTPNATVEACGQPNTGPNLVSIFTQGDDDLYHSVFCRLVTNSCDPNSKEVFPSGVNKDYHYVDSTDALEYMIDFQNIGNGNAFTVTITDTLSPKLDLTTIMPGVSSHSYTWQVLSGRRLRFTFDNINLVPASQDSLLSIGFVKFKIKQVPGNQTGERIENSADIVFDLNAPIHTNTVFNTIGWPVVIGLDLGPVAAAVKVYPNPATGEIFAEVEGMEEGKSLDFELYSIMGQKVLWGSFESGQRYHAKLEHLPHGVYIYRILDQDRMVKAGKLLVED